MIDNQNNTEPMILGGGGSCSKIDGDGKQIMPVESPLSQSFPSLKKPDKQPRFSSKKFQDIGNKVFGAILALILIFAMLPILNIPGMNKNDEAVADEAPRFGNVTINAGSRIALSGNKSMTALGSTTGGNVKMFADQSGGIDVAGSNVNSSVASFLSTNYSTDLLANSLNGEGLLSINDINNNRYYLPTGDREYWLSDTGGNGSLSWQAYANANNTLPDVSLKATGRIDGRNYDETTLVRGPYAWNKNATLGNFTVGAGAGQWDLNSEQTNHLKVYFTDKTWFGNGTTVYNNFHMKSSGTDWNGKPYRSSTVRNLIKGSDAKLFGYVKDNMIYQAKPGDVIQKGTICVFCFQTWHKEITDPTYFARSSMSWTGFMYAQQSFKVLNRYVETQPVYGLSKFYTSNKTIVGQNIQSGTKAIRPSATLNSSNIAFFRNSTNSNANASSTLGSMPVQNANRGSSYKAVVKDSSMSVSAALTSANFGTDRGNVRIEGTTVHVPYGAKTLTINNVNRNGGNYISALSSTQGARQYGILGNSNTVKIDLTNLLSVNVLGSETSVSLFSEQINGSGTSDKISTNPFSFKIRISEAVPFKLTYDADGGSGIDLPATSEVKSGTSISLADGSLLQKEGNTFARWLVTYKLSDEIYTTRLLMNSMQLFTMPYADVTVTALYSGISTGKDSTTEGQEKYLVTFDPNGGLWGTSTSPIAVPIVPGNECPDPGKPTRDGYAFLGWYNRPVGGQMIDIKKVVFTGHTSLYAHWFKGDLSVFLAPKDTDPTKVISGVSEVDLIGIGDIKAAAATLSAGGDNPNSEIYNATNDAYHLFAKISGDGSSANDWLECRIIHTGQHDGDGSGLTFQAVHALTFKYEWDTNWLKGQQTPNWANCTLRSSMNGSIFSTLPSGLQNAILPIVKKYNTTAGSNATVTDKLWLISTTELVSNVSGKQPIFWYDNSHQGSTYAFWNNKNLLFGDTPASSSEQKQLLYAMCCDREKSWLSGYARVRSVSPRYQDSVLNFFSNGGIGVYGGDPPSFSQCISPCFAL